MVFHRYAQDFERVHTQSSRLDSLLIFQNQVDRAGEQAHEGIPFRGRCKEFAEL